MDPPCATNVTAPCGYRDFERTCSPNWRYTPRLTAWIRGLVAALTRWRAQLCAVQVWGGSRRKEGMVARPRASSVLMQMTVTRHLRDHESSVSHTCQVCSFSRR